MTPFLVNVIGLGYIGLPTATLVASKGMRVIGVDINSKVVELVNQGVPPIVEPELEGLLVHTISSGALVAQKQPTAANVYMIAVPTPFSEGFEPDLRFVESAIRSIAPHLVAGSLVIIESTCPVGTTEKMNQLILRERPDLLGDISMAYCPERVLPGKTLFELENNDRVIGGIDLRSAKAASEFYARFVKGVLLQTDSKTAEMCKLVENSYRDVNIAFANELSMICGKAGVDVNALIGLANHHPRVNILQPGPGVGGHCIAVDPWFLVHDFPTDSKMIRTAREVNLEKVNWVIDRIESVARQWSDLNGRAATIACFGLTYKPDIDDLRESPALEITHALIKKGLQVVAVEPNVPASDGVQILDVASAVEVADIAALFVAHHQFKQMVWPSDTVVLDFCALRPASGVLAAGSVEQRTVPSSRT